MENCLVTKLKGSVNNNNLQRLNCISFDLAVTSTPYNYMRFIGATEAIIDGNGYFTDDSSGSSIIGKTTTTPYNYTYAKGVDGDKMYVKSKYDITEIKFAESNNGRTIKEYSTIDLTFLPSLTRLNLSKYDTNVNIDLNKFTETNHIINYIRHVYNSLMVGDIETMVENMISGGRTSGDLVIGGLENGVRLNGETFMTGLSEYVKITFNSATDVTVYQKEDGSGALLASYNGSTWTYNS